MNKGRLRIEWAERQMPVLMSLREDFEREKLLVGIRIGMCLHVTTETAVLARTLRAGGAEIALCGSNPLSTQDDVVETLSEEHTADVYARRGISEEEYYKNIEQVLSIKPHIIMDDGGDLTTVLHKRWEEFGGYVIGGTEETTTGVNRLLSMDKTKQLRIPVIAVNNAMTKHFFDNRYGTGQSTIDGILRATNILLAGKNFVVCGYGQCGRGLASRARGMGAKVIVVEVDYIKALEAVMDGYDVMPIREAARYGDIFVTVTGNINVIRKEHFYLMKDGVILGNSGHFDVEIDVKGLEEISTSRRAIRDELEEFTIQDGKKLYLLARGRLLNLACAEGHPSNVMDMSFANQALAVDFLVKEGKDLPVRVLDVPIDIDREVARRKLLTMGINIDQMTEEQKRYLENWEIGT
ncbi:MAG TPA: adenosylhomocysteinase [bacterium]|nr:adenosylhomocysteinase [bacterium]HPC77065.1 adenosylhomocysteinase [bacterium]HPO81564.1 adenosylhomocysteinase [bacterium]